MARSKRKVSKPLYDMLDIRWNRKISQPTNLVVNTKPYVYVHLNVFCKQKSSSEIKKNSHTKFEYLISNIIRSIVKSPTNLNYFLERHW